MRNRILLALVGTPVLLVVLLGLPIIYTPILISLLSMVASYELSRALGVKHFRIQLYSMVLAAGVPFWVYYGEGQLPALIGLLTYVALLFLEALPSKYEVEVGQIGGVFLFSVFVPYFLSSLVRIGQGPLHQAYILLPIIIPFLSDAMAMFSGMLFGKRKLAPEISPKKTIEGSFGGLLGGTVAALLYGLCIGQILPVEAHFPALFIYGFFGSAVSQIGDLSFSYVKRQNSIKDYGTIFPGHGGVLDRFDSVIFCAPFIEVLIMLLPAFTAL